jgi:hypothetical protein
MDLIVIDFEDDNRFNSDRFYTDRFNYDRFQSDRLCLCTVFLLFLLCRIWHQLSLCWHGSP